MTRIAALLFLLVFPVLAPADQTGANRYVLAQKYFEAAGIEKIYMDRRQMDMALFGQLQAIETKLSSNLSPGQVSELDKTLSPVRENAGNIIDDVTVRMKSDMVKMIANTFSERELGALIAFYQTADGRMIAAKTPLLISGLSSMSSRYAQIMLTEVQKQVVDALQAAAKASEKKPAGKNDGTEHD